jgi:hypothetical protein
VGGLAVRRDLTAGTERGSCSKDALRSNGRNVKPVRQKQRASCRVTGVFRSGGAADRGRRLEATGAVCRRNGVCLLPRTGGSLSRLTMLAADIEVARGDRVLPESAALDRRQPGKAASSAPTARRRTPASSTRAATSRTSALPPEPHARRTTSLPSSTGPARGRREARRPRQRVDRGGAGAARGPEAGLDNGPPCLDSGNGNR